jgi:hypothetical protein
MSTRDQSERRGYNLSDPQMPFCPDEAGVRHFGDSAAMENFEAWLSGPHACELRELDLARDIARRLRTELIYGMPAEAQVYDERDVPTSRNLPMFLEFVFEVLTGTQDPGPLFE